jgi:hypothetical protein
MVWKSTMILGMEMRMKRQGFVDVDGEWEDSATSSERTELRSWNGKVRRGSKCPTLI